MTSIAQKQDELVAVMNELEDWLLQYQLLLEIASEMPTLMPDECNGETLVRGCQSKAWLVCALENGRVRLRADSEALIVKGMIGAVLYVLDGQQPGEIAAASVDFFERTALRQQITTDRFQGMQQVIGRIKQYAADVSTKSSEEQ